MDANAVVEALKVWSALVQAISWPLVIIFALIYFGQPLKKFLHDLGEFRLKFGAGGIEASLVKQQIEAAANLGAATAQRGGDGADGSPVMQGRGIADIVAQAVGPRTARRLSDTTILWVDDRPENNAYERSALAALGIRFELSTSTDDAVQKLRLGKYDLVISDMGRPPDSQAGYTLLAKIRDELKLKVPYLIYAGSNAPEHDAEAHKRGANGSTGSPRVLFERVVAILGQNV